MQELNRIWQKYKKSQAKEVVRSFSLNPFVLSHGEYTRPPVVVPYLVHGHGVLSSFQTRSYPPESNGEAGGGDKTTPSIPKPPIHYFRLRRWMQTGDPCRLSGGLEDRSRIASRILADETGERRRDNRDIWEKLLYGRETHVLRFGWKSQITGVNHDILYIPLTLSDEAIAKEFGEYFVHQLRKESSFRVLCPPIHNFYDTQIFWLTVSFWHLRWQLLTPAQAQEFQNSDRT